MGKPRKKGESGSAVNYMTRNQAVRKLQLSLPDFRKLCILKGIFPRDPARKVSGSGKTYYLAKDLKFMMHDPLVDKFREHRAWRLKVKKAKARKLKDKVASLLKNEPKYTLIHLVKERYPTFMDALRDLDDAITMIHLFMIMPTKTLKPKRIENCRRLALEFQYFIVRTHALRKVFISIKGIYFQAEVFGQTITWIVPHRFNQQTSSNVDYQVMTTFLEFHEVLMGFVNYKLFNSLGIKYPLVIDAAKAGEGENLKALVTESIADNSSATTVPKSVLKATESRISTLDDLLRKVARDDAKSSTKMDSEEAGQESSTTAKTVAEEEAGDIFDEDQRKEQKALEAFKNLFSGCVFFLSREVPRENIEFIVRAFGGQVSWDGGSIEENSNTITHQIVDRGVEPAGRRVEREYVQPQWVFDCVNARILLPVDLYGPTSKLPPHLSPFVDSETEGYTPEFQRKIEEYIRAADGASSAPSTIKMDEDAASEESEESEDEETTYARELAAERKGKYAGDDEDDEDDEEETAAGAKKRRNGSNGMDVEETAEVDGDEEEEEEIIDEQDAYMAKHSLRNRGIRREYDHLHNKKRTAAERDDDEALAMAQSMLPNKKRKLLEHLQRGKRRGEDRAFHLDEKRRKLANKQLSVDERGILVKKK